MMHSAVTVITTSSRVSHPVRAAMSTPTPVSAAKIIIPFILLSPILSPILGGCYSVATQRYSLKVASSSTQTWTPAFDQSPTWM